ncbi:hypothetical protein GCM10010922_05130 [Microbacterium sorbitolivorans]|uniref:DUF4129 domain-containing protein n=1 Tax=Microbacterium sorbitolivorans TaxID=1867410 RepID=A0A367Y680_9MICO|nr:DUF4129 domain-containing protein [Microbacterium sorbitolivorans]RCK61347.1 DUF4129 domain-containing protein [Microbacterium sorbitolivorans]GGF33027.1 hypothetical protein GCM10010922_05130 [Microbacterium sorbitolivorans]
MRRWWAPAGATLCLAVVMVAAAVQGTPRFDPPDWDFGSRGGQIMPTLSEAPPETPFEFFPQQEPGNGGSVVGWILIALAAAVAGVLLFFLVRALIRAWLARVPRRAVEAPGAETFVSDREPDPEAAAPEIRRGIAFARRVIDQHAAPSDAIVAAWVGLEQSASDAGLVRGTAETPAEFALRIITHREAIAGDARELLRLYERVRFAGRVATEDDRAAARRALEAIEEGWR